MNAATPIALVFTFSRPTKMRPEGPLVSLAKNSITNVVLGRLVRVPVTWMVKAPVVTEFSTGAA